MHSHCLDHWTHTHDFHTQNVQGEQRTTYVLLLTLIIMIVEVVAGTLFGSMALLADGWHMGTHVAAFMIALFAYRYARQHANDPKYAFGTGKVGVLGGFASAIALAVVALMMALESIQRLFNPQTIQFTEAIVVACIGLAVNLISALLLKDGHTHGHHHDHHDHHDHHEHHEHHDHNIRAAYIHVLADALTSILAIIALIAGMYLGWHWLDPVMGIVGAFIISRWAIDLLRQSGPILLDGSVSARKRQLVAAAIEQDADNRVTDMHVWKLGSAHYAAIISLVTQDPKPAIHYKRLLTALPWLNHVTIEVNQCIHEHCNYGSR